MITLDLSTHIGLHLRERGFHVVRDLVEGQGQVFRNGTVVSAVMGPFRPPLALADGGLPSHQDLQLAFENHLRVLLEELRGVLWDEGGPVYLILPYGGSLDLPPWFTAACDDAGIRLPGMERALDEMSNPA